MELSPMPRDLMRGLKEKKDEELRIEKLNNHVRTIYQLAIRTAETSINTNYSLDIGTHQMYNINNPSSSEYMFYKDNMTEIVSSLQVLFPDCTVKLAKMCLGNDQKRYDMSKVDEKMLPFIDQKRTFECIVVDWS